MIAPMRDPPAAPTGAMAPNKAKLKFRFFPGGKVIPSKATIFGIIRPPPIPHNPLMIHIDIKLSKNPPHNAQRVHQTQPAVKTFLWP